MDKKSIAAVENVIQYKFKNPALLSQAFDFEPEDLNDPKSNVILRIIGKRSVNYSLTNLLMEYYGMQSKNNPFRTSNGNTVIYDLLDNLSSYDLFRISVNVLNLTSYIESVHGGELVDSDKELFQSIIGAVTLDCGWDVKTVNKVIAFMLDVDYWLDYGFAEIDKHPIVLVFNFCVESGIGLPSYNYKKLTDDFGNEFVECTLAIGDKVFTASDDTLSKSRVKAAEAAYKFLTENKMTAQISKDAGEYTVDNALDTLDNLTCKGYFSFADYNTKEVNGGYLSQCMIDEVDKKFKGFDKEKSKAKNKAAYKMILYVLGKEIPHDEADDME